MTLLEKVLQEDCVQLQQQAATWQEAVKLGCDILQDKGYITADYYDAILTHTAEYGPYYVLAPGFAMPHARPEDGVLKTGFSLVTLQKPVVFGEKENDPVDLVVTLAARDKKEMNESSIAKVMDFIEDRELLGRVRTLKEKGDLR